MARTWLSLVMALVAAPLHGNDDVIVPPEKFIYCTVCHGIQMGGNPVVAAPRLSGTEAWYVEQQLQAFSKGWRGVHPDDNGGHEMRPMAAALTSQEMAAAARFVAATESAAPAVTVDGDHERGKTLYGSCAACHGANGEGNEALRGPALTGLNDWYLLTQLKNYKAGIRGAHPEDTFGQQMRSAAQLLADEQAMRDVIRYIATLD